MGRFGDVNNAIKRGTNYLAPDVQWCEKYGKLYLPVAFPGFSWHNYKKSKGEKAKFNHIPRLKGKFLWAQAEAARMAGAKSLYVAMFDEVDEGTAIFKCTNDPPVGEYILTYEGLPSDHYLWLTGQIAACGEAEAWPLRDPRGVRSHGQLTSNRLHRHNNHPLPQSKSGMFLSLLITMPALSSFSTGSFGAVLPGLASASSQSSPQVETERDMLCMTSRVSVGRAVVFVGGHAKILLCHHPARRADVFLAVFVNSFAGSAPCLPGLGATSWILVVLLRVERIGIQTDRWPVRAVTGQSPSSS